MDMKTADREADLKFSFEEMRDKLVNNTITKEEKRLIHEEIHRFHVLERNYNTLHGKCKNQMHDLSLLMRLMYEE